MKTTDPKNRKKHLRRALLFAAVFSLCASSVFCSYADVTSDTPQLSDDPTLSDEPDLPGTQDHGGSSQENRSGADSGSNSSGSGTSGTDSSSSSGSGTSGTDSSSSSGSGTSGNSGTVITDTPQLGGDTGNTGSSARENETSSGSTAGKTENSGGTGNTGSSGSRNPDTSSGNTSQQETSASHNHNAELSDAPSAGGSASGGVISSAPETGKTNISSEAPASEKKAEEDADRGSAENSSGSSVSSGASVSVGPASGSQNRGAGSVYANDAVSRINLDFFLITPNHIKGNLHVARGCIQLEDGSRQTFDYKDNIHYAFFKMKDTKTDSSGTSWYVAGVMARRFGDTAANDGKYKTELWLNASDCITRSTIDVNTTSATRIAIVKAALSMLGKQYIYGAGGPDAFDCSGLVKYVCGQAGISVPRTSTQLLQLDGQITAAELRPGDIMARAGHCGIYIGNGIFVHASDSSVGVVAEYLSVYNLTNKFTNYINVVGD